MRKEDQSLKRLKIQDREESGIVSFTFTRLLNTGLSWMWLVTHQEADTECCCKDDTSLVYMVNPLPAGNTWCNPPSSSNVGSIDPLSRKKGLKLEV